MTITSLVSEEQADDQVKKIYKEIKKTLGLPFVPNVFKAMATNPEQLETM